MNTGIHAVMPDFCSRRHPFHYVTALNTLMAEGIEPGRIDLIAEGLFYQYKGEVLEQEPAPGEALTGETNITLRIACLSAADHVPYQFFYGLDSRGDRSGDWEARGRELMAPIDSATIRFEAIAGMMRRHFNLGVLDRSHLLRFLGLFGFTPAEANPELSELLFWFASLPGFHRWSGNAKATAGMLSKLIGYPVEIVESVRKCHEIPEDCQSRLGTETARLGDSWIAGRSFTDYDSGYEVVVEGVEAGDLEAYLPGGAGRKRLEWLLGVCMPNNLEYSIRIQAVFKRAAIGHSQRENYLGYSSFA